MKSVLNRVQKNPKKAMLLGALGAVGFISYSVKSTFSADNAAAIPYSYPWSHNGLMDSYDAASIRRGYKVYREVCSACHGMQEIAFRNLENIAFTTDEVKFLASEVEVDDEPDAEGNVEKRPAKAFDYFPNPYKNEKQARAANSGALPPDLSVIIKARPHNEDYVFSLLTGYDEAPPGVKLREGLYFNAYFPGGAIGMAPPLADGSVDYDDGTPGTLSQYAKDVTTFLAYCAKPEEEERKKMGVKILVGLTIFAGFMWYQKRLRWAVVKNRRIEYRD